MLLVPIITCCLKGPSYYLNQSWLALNKIQVGNIYSGTQDINSQVVFEIYLFEIISPFPWGTMSWGAFKTKRYILCIRIDDPGNKKSYDDFT